METHRESTPQLDGSTVEGDRASETALVQENLPSPEKGTDTTPSVSSPGRDGDIPSSGAEPPVKRQKCLTGAPFHVGNVICSSTAGAGTSICPPSEPTGQLEYGSLGVDNASAPLPSAEVPVDIPCQSESELLAIGLAILGETDPWVIEVPPFLEADAPVNEDDAAQPSTVLELQGRTQVEENPVNPRIEELVHPVELQGPIEVEENPVNPHIEELLHPVGLPTRRLIFEKELTDSDMGTGMGGVKLPKENVELHFVDVIPEGLEGHVMTIHDAVTEGKKWTVRLTTVWKLTVKLTRGSDRKPIYHLKDIDKYLKHYALREGHWLQLFWEEPHKRYIVKFERSSAQHIPPRDQRHLCDKTWTMVIRKRLTQKDAFVGCRCAGSIAIMRKKAEKHFPPISMDNTEGVEIKFFYWDNQNTWSMTVQSSTFGKHGGKQLIYRLDSTAAFCKFHHLLKDDYVEIFKSDEPDASYAIRGCKLDERA